MFITFRITFHYLCITYHYIPVHYIGSHHYIKWLLHIASLFNYICITLDHTITLLFITLDRITLVCIALFSRLSIVVHCVERCRHDLHVHFKKRHLKSRSTVSDRRENNCSSSSSSSFNLLSTGLSNPNNRRHIDVGAAGSPVHDGTELNRNRRKF